MSETEIQQWITPANHDAETAGLLSDENGYDYPEIIIYHMHQAVEKYFRALIPKAGRTIRRTHHIDAVAPELEEIAPTVQSLLL